MQLISITWLCAYLHFLLNTVHFSVPAKISIYRRKIIYFRIKLFSSLATKINCKILLEFSLLCIFNSIIVKRFRNDLLHNDMSINFYKRIFTSMNNLFRWYCNFWRNCSIFRTKYTCKQFYYFQKHNLLFYKIIPIFDNRE